MYAQAAQLSQATGPITPVPPVRPTPPVVSSRRLIVDPIRENSGRAMRQSLYKDWSSIKKDNTVSSDTLPADKLPVEPFDTMLASDTFVYPPHVSERQRAFARFNLYDSLPRVATPTGSYKAMTAAAAAAW
jgi:hypothetical protein